MEISEEEAFAVLPALAERTRLEIMVGVLQHRIAERDRLIEELRDENAHQTETLRILAQDRAERIVTTPLLTQDLTKEDYQ